MGFALSEMKVTSSAFQAGGTVPKKHTGEGEDVSPPLAWSDVPEGARSFAVLCHDPDAPLVKPASYGFEHWLLYGIPGDVRELPEGVGDYVQGANDFGRQGYAGPMPPEGHGPHHYYFWVLALDVEPGLPAGLSMAELLQRVESNVLGMNRLIGVYER